MEHRTVLNVGLIASGVLIGFFCSKACQSFPSLRGSLTKSESAVVSTVDSSHHYSAFETANSLPTNSNWLIKEYRKRLALNCSSSWNGWPVNKLVDEDLETSWFSASKDSAAFNANPWVEVTFPQDVEISHVTALGNQEPRWRKGFSIKVGKLELYDSNGKVVYACEESCQSNNFDMRLKSPVNNVRRLRFSSLSDEGNLNGYSDVALGELQVE